MMNLRKDMHMMSTYSDTGYAPCGQDMVDCHWPALRKQLLSQWKKITPQDLDEVGPKRHALALLIQQKHGVAWQLVENYLMSIERSLPMFG